jgi:hypothetical protein
VRVLFVEHAVDFQDVAVASGALELVSGAIEAEDECFLRGKDSMSVLIAMRVGRVLPDASWISLVAGAFALADGYGISWVCRLVVANKIVWLRVAARIVRAIDCRCLSRGIEASAVRRPWPC